MNTSTVYYKCKGTQHALRMNSTRISQLVYERRTIDSRNLGRPKKDGQTKTLEDGTTVDGLSPVVAPAYDRNEIKIKQNII